MIWSRFGKKSIRHASQFFNNINLHVYKLFIWTFCSHPILHSNMFSGILMLNEITIFFFWFKNIVNLNIFFLLDLSLNINNIGERTSCLSFNFWEYSPAKNGTVSTPIYPNRVRYVVYRVTGSSRNNPNKNCLATATDVHDRIFWRSYYDTSQDFTREVEE